MMEYKMPFSRRTVMDGRWVGYRFEVSALRMPHINDQGQRGTLTLKINVPTLTITRENIKIYTGKFYFSPAMLFLIDSYNEKMINRERTPEKQITYFRVDNVVKKRAYGTPDNPPPPHMAIQDVYTIYLTVGVKEPRKYHIEVSMFEWRILEGEHKLQPYREIIKRIINFYIQPAILHKRI